MSQACRPASAKTVGRHRPARGSPSCCSPTSTGCRRTAHSNTRRKGGSWIIFGIAYCKEQYKGNGIKYKGEEEGEDESNYDKLYSMSARLTSSSGTSKPGL